MEVDWQKLFDSIETLNKKICKLEEDLVKLKQDVCRIERKLMEDGMSVK